MAKFKMGDRVVLLSEGGRYKWIPMKNRGQKPGDCGTVAIHYTGECVPVNWDNKSADPHWVEDLLDFVPKEKGMEDTRSYLEALAM